MTEGESPAGSSEESSTSRSGAPAGGSGAGVCAYAPATAGNVICGFDVLGLALGEPGDRVTALPRKEPGVVIGSVTGDGGRIPRDAERNSAGVAAMALLDRFGVGAGVELALEKGLPLSGGMGGSAASAVAAVVATDALLGIDADQATLLECSLEGEKVASGSAHADNVAPCLLGGVVLVRAGARRPVVPLPVPAGLSAALLHPRVELATRDARAVLPDSVPMVDAVAQWGNTAALVAALFLEDLDLMADALQDRVAEPVRSVRIPGFARVKEVALEAGAVGFGISGAGPSMLALCASLDQAERVGESMAGAFGDESTVEADLYVSPVSEGGARVVAPGAPGPA